MNKLILLLLFTTTFTGLTPAPQSRVLLSNTIKHPFSDPTRSDTFKLTIRGNSLLKAEAILEILDQGGKSLYRETFPADLLVDELTVDAYNWTIKQQED